MRSCFILSLFFSVGLISCSNQTEKAPAKVEAVIPIAKDSSSAVRFTITNKQDSVIQEGESIQRYKNGVIKMRGQMKNGKREGAWKSWYEDGTQWSETAFKEGIKNGPTTTWYENGKKRYEGYYTNDNESGKWTYWDENGKQQSSKDYGTGIPKKNNP